MPYLRNSIAYDHGFWYTFVKWWYLQVFFSVFSKFWFFGLLGGKSTKMVQKLCLPHFISQEPYIIWFSFMLHICKMIIPPGIFFYFHFFKTLIFWVVSGVKGQKIVQNDKKFCPSHTPYLGNHTSYDCHLRYTCVKW